MRRLPEGSSRSVGVHVQGGHVGVLYARWRGNKGPGSPPPQCAEVLEGKLVDDAVRVDVGLLIAGFHVIHLVAFNERGGVLVFVDHEPGVIKAGLVGDFLFEVADLHWVREFLVHRRFVVHRFHSFVMVVFGVEI